MRNIFCAFAFILGLVGCTTYRAPYEFRSGITNFSAYSDRGFFITEANSVSFEYKPIGSIYVQEEAGFEVVSNTISTKKVADDVMGSEKTVSTGSIKTSNKFIGLNIEKGLEKLYNNAVQNGANGIINLQTTYWNGGYTISGMAIKR